MGGNSLAVFGIGRTIVNWAGAVLWATGTGTMVLIARAVGADDERRIRSIVVQSSFFVLLVGSILASLCYLAAPRLVALMAGDSALFVEATAFLRAYVLSMVTMVLIFLVLSILQGAGESKMAMHVQILTNALQAVLLLVFAIGVGPFRGIGVVGYAVAVGLARVVGISVGFAMLLGGKARVRIAANDLFSYRPDYAILRDLLRVSLPNGGEMLAKSSARLIILRIVSMTASASSALAAYTIGSQVESLYDMIGSSFSVAAATAVGQNLGANRSEAAVGECHKSARFGLLVAVMMGGAISFWAPQLTSVFAKDPEVIRIGAMLLRVMGFAAPFYMSMIVYAGGLKGAGDTKTPMLISVFGYWLVQIPFAFASVGVLGLDTLGVWVSEALNYLVQGVSARALFCRSRRVRAQSDA